MDHPMSQFYTSTNGPARYLVLRSDAYCGMGGEVVARLK
jgi:hypothetical protein